MKTKRLQTVTAVAAVVFVFVIAIWAQTASKSNKPKPEGAPTNNSRAKTAKPMSRVNPKTLQITLSIDPTTKQCVSDTGDKPVHAPTKTEGGLVVFSAQGQDFTVVFENANFWQGQPNNVPVTQTVGTALYSAADSGMSTHFCVQGKGCAPCGPWPSINPPGKKVDKKKITGSDPNDITVP